MNNEMRWKQRFSNLEKAVATFREVMAIESKGKIEKMALIQAFEFTFELSWKILKDFLEDNGFEVNSPREAIRQAFQSDYIKNGDVWMNALKKRNETTHLYNDEVLDETAKFIIDKFSPILEEMYQSFKVEAGRG